MAEQDKIMEENLAAIRRWRKDVFLFVEEALKLLPAEPLEELRNKPIPFTDGFGNQRSAVLFDQRGLPVYSDLKFYTADMFKNQTRETFERGKRITWQQTLFLEAYNRAINTFDKDSYDRAKRMITVRSGHGTGKDASLSLLSLHFLICFFGAQAGATSNTENQLKDILFKEIWKWRERLPVELKDNVEQLDNYLRVNGAKDWFMRASVARPENPEALQGLHGEYIFLIVDEASGVDDKIIEASEGSLTGKNWLVIYVGNPTRTEGFFFDSHKEENFLSFTQLVFNSEESPIVEEGFCEMWLKKCGGNRDADVYRVRVRGEFPATVGMNDKGWIPLFANVAIHFEPEHGQLINSAIIGVDPSGSGKDHSNVNVRDNIYLKEALREQTSTPKDLARKVETIRDVYNCNTSDIGVDAFGVGAKVVVEIRGKMGQTPNALLMDQERKDEEGKPMEFDGNRFNSFRSELAWRFRLWVLNGGIIITNNQEGWKKELEKLKFKRDQKGRIALMDKVTFKKEYGFSPDRFDASLCTFFKEQPTRYEKAVLTREELEEREEYEISKQIQAQQKKGDAFSSM